MSCAIDAVHEEMGVWEAGKQVGAHKTRDQMLHHKHI